ncbi:MAG: hypothetical protein QG668_126 [Patescibacteria group bacterium]|nr:hypothetical protein [Patescibacteria group bacterium]
MCPLNQRDVERIFDPHTQCRTGGSIQRVSVVRTPRCLNLLMAPPLRAEHAKACASVMWVRHHRDERRAFLIEHEALFKLY